jgi:hypothetical protein
VSIGQSHGSIYGPPEELSEYVRHMDATAAAFLAVLWGVEKVADAEGWDQLPSMFTITREMVEPQLLALTVNTMAPIPPGTDLYALLSEGKRHVRRWFDEDEIGQVLGFALCHEAWQVKAAPGEEDAAMALAAEHRLHEHPNRIETRMVLGADRSGATYSINHARDGDTTATIRFTEPDYDDGKLPRAMRDLVANLP